MPKLKTGAGQEAGGDTGAADRDLAALEAEFLAYRQDSEKRIKALTRDVETYRNDIEMRDEQLAFAEAEIAGVLARRGPAPDKDAGREAALAAQEAELTARETRLKKAQEDFDAARLQPVAAGHSAADTGGDAAAAQRESARIKRLYDEALNLTAVLTSEAEAARQQVRGLQDQLTSADAAAQAASRALTQRDAQILELSTRLNAQSASEIASAREINRKMRLLEENQAELIRLRAIEESRIWRSTGVLRRFLTRFRG